MNRQYLRFLRAMVLFLPLIAWSIQDTSGSDTIRGQGAVEIGENQAVSQPGQSQEVVASRISSAAQDSATVEDGVIGVTVSESSGGDYTLRAAAGESTVGECASADYGLTQGFASAMIEISCDCRPGDANNDGSKNVGDAVYLISYVFKGGAAPVPYPKCSGDANGDCAVNVGDAVYMISYVFKGGSPPVSCDTWLTTCGPLLMK
jgi:hypothetical protein